MKQEDIRQLLERYWQCETSIEDERLLRDAFAHHPLPDDLKATQALFEWKSRQRAIQAAPLQPRPVARPAAALYPVLKIAAAVLLVLTFGLSIQTHYRQEKWMDRLFSDNPDLLDTRKDSTDVVAKAIPHTPPEADSLRPTDEPTLQPPELQQQE